MPHRTSVGNIVTVILAMASWGCTSTETMSGPIVVGTFSRAIDYSPYYVAQHFGWFEEALAATGDSVSYVEFGSRAEISAALDNGSLHVVFAAAPPIIITRAQGNAISIFEISCTLQQEIVVRTELNLSSPADLGGYRVAVLAGTSSHYGLLRTLGNFGLDDGSVDIVFLAPVEARAAFEGGDIDGWAVWPPFVEQQQHSGAGRVLRGGDAVIQSVAGGSDDFLAANPAAAEAIAGTIRRAKSWMLENPDAAQVIVARRLNLDPAVVELAWGKHDWAARLNDNLAADIAAKVEFLREHDQIRRTAPADLAAAVINLEFGGASTLSR